VLAGTGVLLALVLPLLTPLRSAAFALAVLMAVAALNLVLWQRANLVLPLAAALLMISALFALNMSYGFFVEARAKRQITRLFGQYVPPELVEVMSRHPERFSMQGESVSSRCCSATCAGSPPFRRAGPKVLVQVMNEFLTALSQVIHRHQGTIDKYMATVLWLSGGAGRRRQPCAQCRTRRPGHALGHAGDAAAVRRARVAAASGGVGVNTGRMTVGNMGSAIRVAYTVMAIR